MIFILKVINIISLYFIHTIFTYIHIRISYIGLRLKINDKITDDFENLFSQGQGQSQSKIGEKKSLDTDDYKLIFQTRNYNVLRLIGGVGATAYTY